MSQSGDIKNDKAATRLALTSSAMSGDRAAFSLLYGVHHKSFAKTRLSILRLSFSSARYNSKCRYCYGAENNGPENTGSFSRMRLFYYSFSNERLFSPLETAWANLAFTRKYSFHPNDFRWDAALSLGKVLRHYRRKTDDCSGCFISTALRAQRFLPQQAGLWAQ